MHVRFAPLASLFDHLVHAGKQLRARRNQAFAWS
jgi:hypothetical protein